MKRGISLLLSLVMLLSVMTGFSTTAYAAAKNYTCGDLSVSLNTDTGVMTVSGNGYGKNYANNISNRAPWYNSNRNDIKSVVIEEGVKGIGDYWFYNCTNLASVTFSGTVDTIGSDCFRSCTSLTSIELPRNCNWYYKELFLDCSNLKWVIMPNGNSTDTYSGKLPDGTFKNCSKLEEVYIGSGHTSVDTNAFSGCKNLKGVIWDSGEITSTGSNALSNVPKSCTFIDDNNSLSSWCSSNGYAFNTLNGTCSDNTYSSSKLTYSLDTSDFRLSFSGSGDMNSAPWSLFHYLIMNIDFSRVDNTFSISANAFSNCEKLDTVVFNENNSGTLHIYPYAFSGCTATTYWLNIPANTTNIDDHAFYQTGFNYVTIASEKINMGADAFGNGSGGYSRFFGLHDSGVYDWVKSYKNSGYDWHYYCLNDNHEYKADTVEPTCTEKGYDLTYCPYCDADPYKSNYTNQLGHSYKYSGENGSNFIYSCTRCGKNDLALDAVMVQNIFKNAVSHDNDNPPYKQSNYDGRADVYLDGYVNAKDFLTIDNLTKKIDTTNKATTINENTAYQTMEGFGASAAWWSQDVGGWENIDEITELLYGDKKGIRLNIYRYNLGAGSEDDTHIGDWHRRAEDFLSESSNINDSSTYDWNADVNARKALASAKKANNNIKLTLFSNSAPVSLTDNGRGYCSYNTNSNLSEKNYQAFADYVINCAEHFIDEGYNVTNVSPINEPEWAWAADEFGNCSQEGCHFEYDAARVFYNNYMVPALMNSSLNGKVDLSVWECAQLNHSSYWNDYLNNMFSSSTSIFSGNYGKNNANIRSYCDSLDTHSYWASTSDRNAVASKLKDNNYSAVKKVRCTEYCQMTNDGSTGVYDLIQQEGGNTNGMGIEYGIALADIIYQDMTILNAVEWDWWTACSSGIYPDGLVYINYNSHSDVQTSKRLWCLGNYSKFIDDGAKRVSVSTQSGIPSTVEQTAYVNPDGSVAVVYINKGETTQYTSFDNSKYSTFETYVTDDAHDLSLYQSGNVENKAVSIPAKSVTTVVLEKTK